MNRALITSIAAVIGCAVLVLRARLVAILVQGDSVEPTLRPGDRVLVRRMPLRRVHRGQLVVLAPPPDLPTTLDNPPWLVKRVVALPSDTVPSEVPALRAGAAGPAPPAATAAVPSVPAADQAAARGARKRRDPDGFHRAGRRGVVAAGAASGARLAGPVGVAAALLAWMVDGSAAPAVAAGA